MTIASTELSTVLILPDLLSACPYPLRVHPDLEEVERASKEWITTLAGLTDAAKAKHEASSITHIAAYYCPEATQAQFRVFADFMGWIVIIDDLLDNYSPEDARALRKCCMRAFQDPEFHTEERPALMVQSFFRRFAETGKPGCAKRLIDGMDLYFSGSEKETEYRTKGSPADLESYILYRRGTGLCPPLFAMIEYSAGIDLPEEVVSHPVIKAMEDAANDVISWGNDIYSFNAEQARGDMNNLVVVFMHAKGLDLQSAVDYAGELVKSRMDNFEEYRALLPSWGEEVDRMICIYVKGLEDLIIGSFEWTFVTVRYFGEERARIRRDMTVKLLPKKTSPAI
ncbi:hypothetical protein ID866_8514 [Astraeus odoratus]|nr:hypothetical protein ID866_8514 [Astraeus odoratus]